MSNQIATYLAALRSSLPSGLGFRRTTRILREIEEHILEGWAEEQARGAAPDTALQRALARMGSPSEIARGFEPVVDQRRVSLGRYALAVGLGLSLILVGYSLFRYPGIAGSVGGSMGYLLICAVILGLYGWVGLDAARASSRAEALIVWYGVGAGALTGTISFVTAAISNLLLAIVWGQGPARLTPAMLLAIDHRIEEWAFGIPALVGLSLTITASVSLAKRTGKVASGAQVGLWSGMMSALGLVLTGLFLDNTLASLLAQTKWRHDPTCVVSHASALVTCEIGDMLGGVASILLLLPLLWIGLGVFGGLLGRVLASRRARQVSWPSIALAAPSGIVLAADLAVARGARIRPLALFSITLLTTFIVGVSAHLW